MTEKEAIVARHSVRQYIDKPIKAEKIEELKALIEECNREGGTHLQLVTDEPKAFASGMAKYGKFSGISNYIAVVGKKGDDVNLGYLGEKVVIRAQMLGLNTCWVGLSFSKQPDAYQVLDGEKLFCVISLGYGANQGFPITEVGNFFHMLKSYLHLSAINLFTSFGYLYTGLLVIFCSISESSS